MPFFFSPLQFQKPLFDQNKRIFGIGIDSLELKLRKLNNKGKGSTQNEDK
jgi:hypothetical protein